MKRLLNTLYLTNPDAYLRKKDDALSVYIEQEKVMSAPFHLLEGVVLFGHVGCSTSVLGACVSRGVSVSILDEGGRFQARVNGPTSGNVLLRREQYRRSVDESACLLIAKRFVTAKVHNARVVLQHYARDYPDMKEHGVANVIDELKRSGDDVRQCGDLNELRGVEGNAAHAYYSMMDGALRSDRIVFAGRTKRPPKNPVNAALSFFYTMLSRELVSACESVGLDPQMGYLHACRPGRASLALDLIEELRAPIVDRFVLSLFNRKQLDVGDFLAESQGYLFKEGTRKKVLGYWQQKKQDQIVHPFLGERMPLGLVPFVQAQLFARYLRGDLEDYPAFLWR
ncbi:type I-C CRISPR-associated endonuclease Cas1c [Atopobium sp. oral taxon 810]|uniref:type I-C CRISPR-associated endonuclease Cas1c n=1 Tax=Atopobium sp. oral taxon 810 TaxID=712158 RepID=UPI0003963123|nr:type I-C CRISPR-associated endonuclease Cas1c [Atopobium sp. oral taxon 810]ERI04263.1 CRISPR-associated endonuclease Cas1, DVULG subtype [Atopobium sp. oral taxon 810 str. F0209]